MLVIPTLALSLAAASLVAAVPVKVIETRSCASVELIFAAGTFEIGLGQVGKPLSGNLTQAIPGLSTYSVPYDTAPEYLFTVVAGAILMQKRIASTLAACPGTKFALAGYSKGAMVVHAAATGSGLTSTQRAAVKGIAVFGDPNTSPKGIAAFEGLQNTWPINNPVVGGNLILACVATDDFCDGGGPNGLAAHLSYGTNGDVPAASKFLVPLLS